jgi:hypothetical protein
MHLYSFSRAASFSTSVSLAAAVFCVVAPEARAQTAPVFEAPTATGSGPTAASALLLRDELNGTGAEAAGPTTSAPAASATFTEEAGASANRALRFDYTLSATNDAPEVSLPTGGPLAKARAVRLKLKTSAPAAVAIWFETAAGDGNAKPLRYSTTVWSRGGGWLPLELDAARFHLTPADDKIATWNSGWGSVTRWGVQDATNTWSTRVGQGRSSGARSLWIDDIEVSTRTPSNSLQTASASAPAPLPAPVPDAEAGDEKAEFEANSQAQPQLDGGPQELDEGARQGFDDPRGQVEVDGEFGDEPGEDEPEANEVDQARVQAEAPQMVVQDGWGASELWIPFNSEVSPIGTREGLKWSFVRLANRDSTLLSPVNGLWLRDFPEHALKRTPRDPRIAFRVQPDRLVSLAIDLSTTRATRLSVAVHERSGAVYSAVVALDPRRRKHRQLVALPDLKIEGARRDPNGQLDLAQIEAISLTDAGAQRGLPGPNEITLHGVAWIY